METKCYSGIKKVKKKRSNKRRGGRGRTKGREREEKVEPPIPLFCKPNLKL